MATDDDPATLRERVRALEQTVQEQQSTIQQLMPSRRAILAGGAGLLGGAALTGQASAQSAAGQVGTSSEPVDVEAATVNVRDGLSTPSAFVSGTLTATDVNTDSVNTNQVINSDVSEGQTTELVQGSIGADDDGGAVLTQPTDSVSTTATTILVVSSVNFGGALVTVSGTDGSAFFVETVQMPIGFGSPSVIGTPEELSSPASRTYSRSGADLQLTMGSGTYEIKASALSAQGGV